MKEKLYSINGIVNKMTDDELEQHRKSHLNHLGYANNPKLEPSRLDFPETVLSNGLRVINFNTNMGSNKNSNTAFEFEDGSILTNVPVWMNKLLNLQSNPWSQKSKCGKFTTIRKKRKLTRNTIVAINFLQDQWDIDIIIVPSDTLVELKKQNLAKKCYTAIRKKRRSDIYLIDKFGAI